MDDDGDKGDRIGSSRLDREKYGPPGDLRTTFVRNALRGVTAVIAIGAAAAAIPSWGSADFPVARLIIYVAGMGFVTMPLCLYYEALLKSHEERVAHARHAHG